MSDGAREIARAFVDARTSWSSIERYPGDRPGSLDVAYAIQNEALSIWDRKVGGWKIGRINSPNSERLGANRLVGPVFSDTIQFQDNTPARFRIFENGFAAVEAEFMLRLAPKDKQLPDSAEEAMDWIDEIRVGIEVAASPYKAINDDGPCVTVSDHGNNAGLLLGEIVPQDRWTEIDKVEVALDIDGCIMGKSTVAEMLDGPFGSVAFLLRNLAARGIEAEAGWWISTGAITGVHDIRSGETAKVLFDGFRPLELSPETRPDRN